MKSKEFPKGHPQVAQPAIQQRKHLGRNFRKMLKEDEMEPFNYFDKGTMATVGRNKAVVDIGKMYFGGAFAWFLWMFVHLWFLVGFRNRVITFFNWTDSYINYDKAARLIIRPFKKLPPGPPGGSRNERVLHLGLRDFFLISALI